MPRPYVFIECKGEPTDPKVWTRRQLLDRDVLSGHTLAVADINGDGHLDIFCAEMHTPGSKVGARHASPLHCAAGIGLLLPAPGVSQPAAGGR